MSLFGKYNDLFVIIFSIRKYCIDYFTTLYLFQSSFIYVNNIYFFKFTIAAISDHEIYLILV